MPTTRMSDVVCLSMFFFVLWMVEATEGSSCNETWCTFQGHEYLVHAEKEKFVKAWVHCLSYEPTASLLSIEDRQEIVFIRQELHAADYWLGLYQESPVPQNRSGWYWVDGAKYDGSLHMWGVLQPSGDPLAHCTVLHRDENDVWLWRDQDCGEEYPYICKRGLGGGIGQTTEAGEDITVPEINILGNSTEITDGPKGSGTVIISIIIGMAFLIGIVGAKILYSFIANRRANRADAVETSSSKDTYNNSVEVIGNRSALSNFMKKLSFKSAKAAKFKFSDDRVGAAQQGKEKAPYNLEEGYIGHTKLDYDEDLRTESSHDQQISCDKVSICGESDKATLSISGNETANANAADQHTIKSFEEGELKSLTSPGSRDIKGPASEPQIFRKHSDETLSCDSPPDTLDKARDIEKAQVLEPDVKKIDSAVDHEQTRTIFDVFKEAHIESTGDTASSSKTVSEESIRPPPFQTAEEDKVPEPSDVKQEDTTNEDQGTESKTQSEEPRVVESYNVEKKVDTGPVHEQPKAIVSEEDKAFLPQPSNKPSVNTEEAVSRKPQIQKMFSLQQERKPKEPRSSRESQAIITMPYRSSIVREIDRDLGRKIQSPDASRNDDAMSRSLGRSPADVEEVQPSQGKQTVPKVEETRQSSIPRRPVADLEAEKQTSIPSKPVTDLDEGKKQTSVPSKLVTDLEEAKNQPSVSSKPVTDTEANRRPSVPGRLVTDSDDRYRRPSRPVTDLDGNFRRPSQPSRQVSDDLASEYRARSPSRRVSGDFIDQYRSRSPSGLASSDFNNRFSPRASVTNRIGVTRGLSLSSTPPPMPRYSFAQSAASRNSAVGITGSKDGVRRLSRTSAGYVTQVQSGNDLTRVPGGATDEPSVARHRTGIAED